MPLTREAIQAAAGVSPNVKKLFLDSLVDSEGNLDGLVLGSVSGSGVSAVKSNNCEMQLTTLTLTNTPVTVTDDPGVAQYCSAGKIYTFPKGRVYTFGASVVGDLTLGVTGTIINAFASFCALGTAIATTGATLTGTEADILSATANPTASSKVSAVNTLETVTIDPLEEALDEPVRIFTDGVSGVPVVLNFLVTDDATHTSGTGTFTGTVKLFWTLRN